MIDLGIIVSASGVAIVMVATTICRNVVRRRRRRRLEADLEIRRAAIRLAYSLRDPEIDHQTVYVELYAFGRSVHQDGFSVAVCKHQMKMLLASALDGTTTVQA